MIGKHDLLRPLFDMVSETQGMLNTRQTNDTPHIFAHFDVLPRTALQLNSSNSIQILLIFKCKCQRNIQSNFIFYNFALQK